MNSFTYSLSLSSVLFRDGLLPRRSFAVGFDFIVFKARYIRLLFIWRHLEKKSYCKLPLFFLCYRGKNNGKCNFFPFEHVLDVDLFFCWQLDSFQLYCVDTRFFCPIRKIVEVLEERFLLFYINFCLALEFTQTNVLGLEFCFSDNSSSSSVMHLTLLYLLISNKRFPCLFILISLPRPKIFILSKA